MRSRRGVLLLAFVLAVVGIALVYTGTASTDELGWFAYAPESTSGSSGLSVRFTGGLIFFTQTLIGYGLLWLATMLTAGVVGHWLAARSFPQTETGTP